MSSWIAFLLRYTVAITIKNTFLIHLMYSKVYLSLSLSSASLIISVSGKSRLCISQLSAKISVSAWVT